MPQTITTIFFIAFCFMNISAQVQLGQTVYGLPGTYFGQAVAISHNGARIAASGPIYDGMEKDIGYVVVYDLQGDSLIQVGDTLKGYFEGEWFGSDVAISASGNRLAVGANLTPVGNIKPGSILVYDWDGAHWRQVGDTLFGISHQDRFGDAIDISADGKRIIVGLYGDNTGGFSGNVIVYEEVAGQWQQIGQNIRGAAKEQIGCSVSINEDGSRIAFGRNQSDPSEIGFIRIYEYQNSMWEQVGSDIVGEAAGGWAGASVSLSSDGKRVAYGAPLHEDPGKLSGSAYVYEEVSGAWLQLGNEVDGDGGYFGVDIDLSGDGNRLAVGAPFRRGGEVTLYHLKDNAWIQLGERIHDQSTNDYFGDDVKISSDGKRMVSGGWFNKTVGINCGLLQLYSIPRIVGHVYNDLSLDCTKDNIDLPLPGRYAIVEPGSILVKSNRKGMYSLDTLPMGQYTITFDTSGPWIPICPVMQTFEIPDADTIMAAPSMGFQESFHCTRPQISVVMPSITRCFDEQKIFVQVCNEPLASASLEDPFIILRLDPNITPLAATVPYESLGNFQYKFSLDTLHPGQCALFSINAHVSCDAELGQTLCIESALFPSDTCRDVYASLYQPRPGIACDLPYDGSDLEIGVSCDGDSLRFEVGNHAEAGIGDMSCFSQVRIYRDEFLVKVHSIQLNGGSTKAFTEYADGYTWRIEADQHPMYPGWSRPSASIELCGDAENWTAGLINYFNLNDLDPALDIFCDQVTGSYDPNDKSAFPVGIGDVHAILPNQQIEYLIRFQNTGNDTAINVVIRDTLDKNLDLFSIANGPSSHGHEFHIASPGVLEWYFPNILLPDSNVNVLASQGFVSYTIRQKIDLPEGTVLENKAAIYFDFNEPIITNTTFHTIKETQLISGVHEQPSLDDPSVPPLIKLYPNPATDLIRIESEKPIQQVTLFNSLGIVVHQVSSVGHTEVDVAVHSISPGLYRMQVVAGDQEVVYRTVVVGR